MKYILGVDVGGSKTHASIASSDGKILAITQVCGAIYSDMGMDKVMNTIKSAIDVCLLDANIQIDDINIGVFGMTGVDWPFEKEMHEKAIKDTFPEIGEIIVCNDSILAFHAGAKKPWGAILCSGTGFNAAAIAPNGESVIYGFYVDAPHCGGKSLGRQIIKTVCNASVKLCDETILTKIVLDFLDANNTDDLLMNFLDNKYSKEKLLKLPAKLFSCYSKNDKVSIEMVENMYKEQAAHAIAAFKMLKMENTNPDVILSGGMLKAAPKDALDEISSYIACEIPNINIYYSMYEPIFGALKMGLMQLNASASDISSLYMSADKNNSMLRNV